MKFRKFLIFSHPSTVRAPDTSLMTHHFSSREGATCAPGELRDDIAAVTHHQQGDTTMTRPPQGVAEIDPRAFAPLLEESQDLHSDSMHATQDALDALVETGQEARASQSIDPEAIADFAATRSSLMSSRFGGHMLVAAGAGAAFSTMLSDTAFASQPTDVQVLRTAASIENLAIATYKLALTLPFIGGKSANATVKAFVKTTVNQHEQHLSAFNNAAVRLGGKSQTKPDPVLLKVVDNAKAGLTNAAAVVALALELEQGAAETYVANIRALKDHNARAITASIMGVEAQHAAILREVQALLHANAANLIAVPPSPLSALPSVAGSLAFPNPFFPTNQARPGTEGA
jgi:rubrerythrin